jgi:hypothetical protein
VPHPLLVEVCFHFRMSSINLLNMLWRKPRVLETSDMMLRLRFNPCVWRKEQALIASYVSLLFSLSPCIQTLRTRKLHKEWMNGWIGKNIGRGTKRRRENKSKKEETLTKGRETNQTTVNFHKTGTRTVCEDGHMCPHKKQRISKQSICSFDKSLSSKNGAMD